MPRAFMIGLWACVLLLLLAVNARGADHWHPRYCGKQVYRYWQQSYPNKVVFHHQDWFQGQLWRFYIHRVYVGPWLGWQRVDGYWRRCK